MQPVFHLNFPSVDLSSSVRAQMLATIEEESADWPKELVSYARSLVDALAPLVTATAGTSGKAIVLVSGNMSGQIQYVVSKLA
jgi:hypothetical protein